MRRWHAILPRPAGRGSSISAIAYVAGAIVAADGGAESLVKARALLYSQAALRTSKGNAVLLKETMTSQSFTFIDPAGNQAQYTLYGADRHAEYHWSTDHGDSGFEHSYEQAQNRARTALKSSMAAKRRSDQRRP